MIFVSTFFHFKMLSHSSLRSRRLEVVGERENGSVRGRNATRAFFSRARFFLCPQTLSTGGNKQFLALRIDPHVRF